MFGSGFNGKEVVTNVLASAIGPELDKAALSGGLVTGANDEGSNLPYLVGVVK